MDRLTPEQSAEMKTALLGLRDDLQRMLDVIRDGTKPVDLKEPIGRLTRMDAIQQQNMSLANRRNGEVRLQQVERALAAMERDEYGLCLKCDNPIDYRRLKARPEAPYCLPCQDGIDRKHGSR